MSEKKQKYSITALSRLLKIDRGTVRERLVSLEVEPVSSQKGKETLYELTEADLKLLGNDEHEAEKLRKTKAEADLKELELANKRGEFASVKEFTEIVQKIFGKLHKKLAVNLPNRLANQLHNANSSSEVTDILRNEIGKEFESLRSDWKGYL